ncbi:DUF2550 domain-containing protein [Williamsia sterculiae]|uniref:DUF2550 domain-containing protein n=1 Tax=Williamsia sterculiae TaxID=1344003 RepID=A0A1N7E2Y2_9NOCA|nr:DUF2550 domain-containing protein [Williamsia sterculiae]SIR82433.1 Protein of unknown function [Williamsia sterculiae]
MTILLCVLVVCAIIGVVAVSRAVVRFGRIRHSGTAAAMRVLPARDHHGWRHGIVRYDDETIEYFRVASLRVGPDRELHRQDIEVRGRREPTVAERDLIDGMVVLEVIDQGRSFELALGTGAITAFQSWLESRPSQRSERRRPRG